MNLVLLPGGGGDEEGGDRSDLEYAKNFYDVGRSTMNRISLFYVIFYILYFIFYILYFILYILYYIFYTYLL